MSVYATLHFFNVTRVAFIAYVPISAILFFAKFSKR